MMNCSATPAAAGHTRHGRSGVLCKGRTFGEENDISEEAHSALWGLVATLVPLLHFHIYLQGNELLEPLSVLMYAPGRCLAILGKDNCRLSELPHGRGLLALQAEWRGQFAKLPCFNRCDRVEGFSRRD